ncbi:dihydroorotate dehydrogenase (quinone), mitochondrial-like [Nilaparvata lugens]|uniref:dihydroorotate dehydrogenase (quinone), mitochondrial-like n=1 Tax=Nilaparvata lugens TaxID=108931 RepID=UPI00193CD816|nr:dihydroorotate dehydrogenase (quinone), mitochondrial-like [Nilaparvata lugens]
MLQKKLKQMLIVCTGGFTAFSAVSIYKGNEKYYENVLLPLVHKLDPELSHKLAVFVSKYQLLPQSKYKDPAELSSRVWHLSFSNPVGVAAGFDKHAEAVVGLAQVGFGFVEIGSVTPLSQPGNPKPRVFRLSDNHAIINSLKMSHLLTVEERAEIAAHYEFWGSVVRPQHPRPKRLARKGTAESAFVRTSESQRQLGIEPRPLLLLKLAPDLSSQEPQHPRPKRLARKGTAESAFVRTSESQRQFGIEPRPLLLLKLAPDLSSQEVTDIVQVLQDKKCRVDGLVISNTTIARDDSLIGPHVHEVGGLSGRPLTQRSTEMISQVYKLTKGQIPIIGVGGVFTGQDAYDKIKAGASLIQLYTSFVYHGPPRIERIKKELHELLQSDGYRSIQEAVGKGIS